MAHLPLVVLLGMPMQDQIASEKRKHNIAKEA